jgi:hypothetical protein
MEAMTWKGVIKVKRRSLAVTQHAPGQANDTAETSRHVDQFLYSAAISKPHDLKHDLQQSQKKR